MNLDAIDTLAQRLQDELDTARLLCGALRREIRELPEPDEAQARRRMASAPAPPKIDGLPSSEARRVLEEFVREARQWASENREFLAPRTARERRCADIEAAVQAAGVAVMRLRDDLRGEPDVPGLLDDDCP